MLNPKEQKIRSDENKKTKPPRSLAERMSNVEDLFFRRGLFFLFFITFIGDGQLVFPSHYGSSDGEASISVILKQKEYSELRSAPMLV